MLEYGKQLTGRGDATDVLEDLNLPPIEAERQGAEQVKRIKDNLRGNYRQQVLEKIVPKWYHRNDGRLKDHTAPEHKEKKEDEPSPEMPTEDDEIESEHAQKIHHEENPPKKQKVTKKQKVAEEAEKRKDAEKRHNKEPERTTKPAEDDRETKPHAEKTAPPKKVEAAEKPVATGSKVEVSQTHDSEANDVADLEKDSVNAETGTEKKTASDEVETPKSVPGEEAHIQADEENKKDSHKTTEQPEVESAKGEASTAEAKKEDALAVPVTERTLHTMEDFPNQSQCPGSVTSVKTTLMVQCSLDRMWILNETCQRWHDPIVAVVHMANDDTVFDEWKTSCPQMTIVPYVADKNEKEWNYPVNRLRNIGLDAVQTSHVIVADVDFVPSQDLDQTIRVVLEERQRQRAATNLVAAEDRDAIVVPAFERVEHCANQDCSQFLKADGSYLPKTKDDLRGCVNDKHCTVFQAKNNWEGHHSTNSQKWLQGDYYEADEVTLEDQSKSKIIKRVPCFDSLRYEPYVVIRWCPSSSSTKPAAPYYDERFYGYGKNKIQLVSHLRMLAYQFSILPEGFIVHNPHADSKAKKVWDDVEDYKLHEQMDALYPQFLKELIAKYKAVTDPRIIVQPCDRPNEKH